MLRHYNNICVPSILTRSLTRKLRCSWWRCGVCSSMRRRPKRLDSSNDFTSCCTNNVGRHPWGRFRPLSTHFMWPIATQWSASVVGTSKVLTLLANTSDHGNRSFHDLVSNLLGWESVWSTMPFQTPCPPSSLISCLHSIQLLTLSWPHCTGPIVMSWRCHYKCLFLQNWAFWLGFWVQFKQKDLQHNTGDTSVTCWGQDFKNFSTLRH